MPTTPPNLPRTGLVLQGGGARGAYQVGVLKAVAEIHVGRSNPFPVISGTSVGAINAAPLAAHAVDFPRAVAQLERLWRNLTCSRIFRTDVLSIASASARWLWTIAFGGFGVGHPRALLDNRPLEKLLNEELHDAGISEAIRAGALDALCITTSSYTLSRAITFFQARDDIAEWRRARRQGLRATIEVKHLMASSSLPFFFPAVNIEGRYFGDGALRLMSPLSPAIQMGADRLFVIGIRDSTQTENAGPEVYPSIGAMAGHALDILFNDNLDADIERLRRINRTVSLLTPERQHQSGLRIIDVAMVQPSQDLRDIASEHAAEMPRTLQLLLRSVGAWQRDSRLVSYLLFEPGYIGALIDLGYADTMARRDELRVFFESQGVSPEPAHPLSEKQ